MSKIFKHVTILSFLAAIFVILLGFLGIIDKNGPLEHEANEFLSSTTNVPIEVLEKFEGVKSR